MYVKAFSFSKTLFWKS